MTLIRNGGRDLCDLRRVHIVERDFLRERGISYLLSFGRTQIIFSAFADLGKGEDPAVDFTVSPSVLWEEDNPFFQKKFAENVLKKLVNFVVSAECFSIKGLCIECHVLQHDGGLSTAISLACYHTLVSFFKSEIPTNAFNRVVGISCGLIKGNVAIDLDSQEFFQADVVFDWLFDEKGGILGIPFFFSREKEGISQDRVLNISQKAFLSACDLFQISSESSCLKNENFFPSHDAIIK
jgi:ribonuclease PH